MSSRIQSNASTALLQLLAKNSAAKKQTALPATAPGKTKIPSAADLIQGLFKQNQASKEKKEETQETLSSQILSISQYLNPKTRASTIAKMLPFLQTSAQMLITDTNAAETSSSGFGFPGTPSLNLFI